MKQDPRISNQIVFPAYVVFLLPLTETQKQRYCEDDLKTPHYWVVDSDGNKYGIATGDSVFQEIEKRHLIPQWAH
jgi:hypothetical protein